MYNPYRLYHPRICEILHTLIYPSHTQIHKNLRNKSVLTSLCKNHPTKAAQSTQKPDIYFAEKGQGEREIARACVFLQFKSLSVTCDLAEPQSCNGFPNVHLRFLFSSELIQCHFSELLSFIRWSFIIGGVVSLWVEILQ